MDYAKLAYLKAEDLESRMQKSLPVNKISKQGVPRSMLQADTNFGLGQISGQGAVALFVNLRFDEAVKNSKVTLLINGNKAQTEYIFNNTASFMLGINIDKSAQISLVCDSSVLLLGGDVMVVGSAEIDQSNHLFKLDFYNGKAGVVRIQSGITFFEADDIKNIVYHDGIFLGFGDDADICRFIFEGEDAWLVVHKDGLDNAFLSVVKSGSQNITKTIFVGGQTDSVALMHYQGRAVIGCIKSGKAYVGTIDNKLNMHNFASVDTATKMDFIKDSYPPAVVLFYKDKNVLRMAEKEIDGKDLISLNLGESLL